MILKYKVPLCYRHIFNEKKIIYCKVLSFTGTNDKIIYLVKMINFNGITNVFANNELDRINLLDRLKIKFKKF